MSFLYFLFFATPSTALKIFKRHDLFLITDFGKKERTRRSKLIFFFLSLKTIHTQISSFPSEVSYFIKIISFSDIFVSSSKKRNFRSFPSKSILFFLKTDPIHFERNARSFFFFWKLNFRFINGVDWWLLNLN